MHHKIISKVIKSVLLFTSFTTFANMQSLIVQQSKCSFSRRSFAVKRSRAHVVPVRATTDAATPKPKPKAPQQMLVRRCLRKCLPDHEVHNWAIAALSFKAIRRLSIALNTTCKLVVRIRAQQSVQMCGLFSVTIPLLWLGSFHRGIRPY